MAAAATGAGASPPWKVWPTSWPAYRARHWTRHRRSLGRIPLWSSGFSSFTCGRLRSREHAHQTGMTDLSAERRSEDRAATRNAELGRSWSRAASAGPGPDPNPPGQQVQQQTRAGGTRRTRQPRVAGLGCGLRAVRGAGPAGRRAAPAAHGGGGHVRLRKCHRRPTNRRSRLYPSTRDGVLAVVRTVGQQCSCRRLRGAARMGAWTF